MQDVYKELETLCAIPAISGQEDKLVTEVVARLKDTGAQLHVDRLGNVTATFSGRRTQRSLLLFAHLDEIGLIVKGIDKNGYLRVERIGGVPEKTLLGTFVDVHTIDNKKSVTGCMGCYSHHITPPEKKMSVPSIKEMYIDIGCESREEVLSLGIEVGCMVTYTPTFRKSGSHRVVSKALDNRMAVYILLRLAEHLRDNPPDATIHLCFSVQEEFNIRGCLPVFERLRPEAAICLDITPAFDTPETMGSGEVVLGAGPAVLYFNFHGRGTLGGLLPNPKLTAYIREKAEEKDIYCQHDVVIGVITDDAFTQLTGTEGVAMAHISVPIRYSHSPIETLDLRDLEDTVVLCQAVADGFDDKLDLERGI